MNKQNKYIIYKLFSVAVILLFAGFAGIYTMKKDSANGRLLMWTVTAKAIGRQPVMGTGLGRFQIAQGEGIPTGIMGFSDVQITDKYIYAVFHGRSFKEIASNLQQGLKHEDGGRSIYVFNLKGNLVRKYTLDHAIYGIDVDEDTGYIIATDVNSDEPILQFKI